jgi:sugar lactone lactonase YvrE
VRLKTRVMPVSGCTAVSVLSIAALIGCGGGAGSNQNSSPPPAATPSYAVADSENNRVLLFDSPLATYENASIELGQQDFISGGAPTQVTANGFTPQAVATDASGNLFVADSSSCRILRFQPPFQTDMSASLVIGSSSSTTDSAASCTATAATLGQSNSGHPYGASAMAFDGSGNLWVADSPNSRVLEFEAPLSSGMSASAAIGQTDMTAASCNQSNTPSGPDASTLCNVRDISFDTAGDLWVVDSGNNRVLEFKPPFSTGVAAILELGQPAPSAFSSSSANNNALNPTATTLDLPAGIAFDSTGNVWVADTGNNRVLEYSPPFSNGMAATMELGQPISAAFTSGSEDVSQSGLAGASGISFDKSGDLLVDDSGNNRVMIFDPPFTSGMNAAAVVGQVIFSSGYSNGGRTTPEANTLSDPLSIASF